MVAAPIPSFDQLLTRLPRPASTWLEIPFLTFKIECSPRNRAAARYSRAGARLRRHDFYVILVCAAARPHGTLCGLASSYDPISVKRSGLTALAEF
ncbi:hypothetical protein PIB30_077014 [Stylosanthes scabra]|uniref:Uncharacterized protein n=1 Tax=Stylosanthes scabra TaxID=79078 RepID=A0ABU6SSJ4_9FABA|nr:hypothetical protein [Stylosanthes scabra]